MHFNHLRRYRFRAATFGLVVGAFMAGAIANGAYAQSELEFVSAPEFDRLYLASSFRAPLSRKIYVIDVPVVFSEAWMARFASATGSRYQKRVVRKYGDAFEDKIREELEEAGWIIAEAPADDTFILRLRLYDLYIYAPDERSMRQTITRNAGRATAEISFETPEGRPVMKIIDSRETQDNIGSPIANRSNNLRYFKLLMERWSKDAMKYMEQVMAVAESQRRGDSPKP